MTEDQVGILAARLAHEKYDWASIEEEPYTERQFIYIDVDELKKCILCLLPTTE